MGVIYANKKAVEEYFASPALNQSKLKDLEQDPSLLLEEVQEKKESTAFLIGKGVDILLLSPKGEYEETYYVSKLEKMPSDAMIRIVKTVVEKKREAYYNHFLVQNLSEVSVVDAVLVKEKEEVIISEENIFNLEVSLPDFKDFCGDFANPDNRIDILSACEQENWNPKWGEEARYNNILKEGTEYFKDLVESEGKVVLSAQEDGLIKKVANSLRTHHRTAFLFDVSYFENSEVFDIYYQLPIYFTYRGVACKALLDIVLVEKDVITKEIKKVFPYDLKTMSGNTINFDGNVRSFRYDRQSAFYDEALFNHLGFDASSQGDALKVQPFQFVVESTTKVGKPLIYKCSRELLEIGKKGITTYKKFLGIEELVDLYSYHVKNGFDEEKIIKEAAGEPLLLGWDKIQDSDGFKV